MALDLITRIFCDPGDVIIAEAPSYVGALGVFRAYQVDVEHVAMDEHGLNPEALRERLKTLAAQGKTPKFVYTIPTFHNPAGLSQPQDRRMEILQICQSAGVLIIEDDPYGLLGFDGHIPQAIRSHDSDGVLYLGSFSQTFAAGIRVGWAVAPHGVREKLTLAAESAVLCPPAFSQLTISTYLDTQPWMDQIKIFREVYRERRDATLEALTQYMPDGTTWTHPTGGFYVWVTLPEGMDGTAMLPRAVTARVAYVPGTAFYINGDGRQSILGGLHHRPETGPHDRAAGAVAVHLSHRRCAAHWTVGRSGGKRDRRGAGDEAPRERPPARHPLGVEWSCDPETVGLGRAGAGGAEV